VYDCWADAANPTKTVAPISIGMLVAVALTIQPTSDKALPEMKNQRRPKRSEKRPQKSCPSPKVKM